MRGLFLFLGFADEFFTALGAGDGDFAFSPGDPNLLAALGAVKIPVLFIFEPLQKHQIFPVFLIPLIGIAGKAAENHSKQKCIRNYGKNQIYQRRFDKHTNQANHKTNRQQRNIQLVRTVAAHHKPPETGRYLCAKITKPITDTAAACPLLPSAKDNWYR